MFTVTEKEEQESGAMLAALIGLTVACQQCQCSYADVNILYLSVPDEKSEDRQSHQDSSSGNNETPAQAFIPEIFQSEPQCPTNRPTSHPQRRGTTLLSAAFTHHKPCL